MIARPPTIGHTSSTQPVERSVLLSSTYLPTNVRYKVGVFGFASVLLPSTMLSPFVDGLSTVGHHLKLRVKYFSPAISTAFECGIHYCTTFQLYIWRSSYLSSSYSPSSRLPPPGIDPVVARDDRIRRNPFRASGLAPVVGMQPSW
jgi:hypothetical protein